MCDHVHEWKYTRDRTHPFICHKCFPTGALSIAEAEAMLNEHGKLEAELEQWRAEHQDETDPKIRPMTRTENAWMDAEGKIGSLEAENAAAFELLDVYEKENERLREALVAIADTSPNWMQKDAVADSEKRMRQMAEDALKE